MRKTKKGLKLIFIIAFSVIILMANMSFVQADTQNQINFNKMGYKEIAAGMYQTLAIDESGNLWSWGLNNNGQLGNGGEVDVNNPVQIKPGTKFTQVSAGNLFCLALDEDGNIWSFGTNGVGQLGVDGITKSNEPVKIASETTFKSISAGSSHGLAIDINNNLWSWGLNSNGQLGNGTNDNSNTPVQIMSDINFTEITAGYNSSAAISTTGALYTWGENSEGQLGDGTNEASSTPKNIETSKTYTKVQMSKGGNYTLAIDTEGKLYAWGNNQYGQLGNETFENSNTPIAIMEDKQIKEITLGYNHTLAIDTEGKLYAWGANGEGKLGTGNEILTNTPVQISEDKTFKKVSAGWNHTVAIEENGSLYVWGGNESGELGIEDIEGSKTPIAISKKESFSYKIEHYKQTETGYELVLGDTQTIEGIVGKEVIATPKTYEGYIWNKYAKGTVLKGEIKADGSLVLKLYYDKLVQNNFNISITNKSAEDSEGVENSTYDVTVEYCDGTSQEFKDIITNENGNIILSNVVGKNIMKVYFKQTSVAGGFISDTSKKYVEIKVNNETSQIELTGAKTAGVIANTNENTLYITQFNNKLNYENTLRIHAIDNIDNEIELANIPFTVTYPDGRNKQLITNEEGIAEISNLQAPGVGDFIYEIEQLATLSGYVENKTVKYVNITFDENGIITKVEALSEKTNATKETQTIDSIQNIIANINIEQTRDSQNAIFSDYSLHIIEQDKDTGDNVEGVTYKIVEKAITAGLSNIVTLTKTTNALGQINTDVVNGQEVILTIKRTKVPSGYKLLKEEIIVKLTKNAEGQYELQEPIEGVSIDNTTKTITVNRQLYKVSSIHNVAKTKVNNEIFITKVDENLRPLQGVVLELRENSSQTRWELKTDDNGLAKITSEDVKNAIGSEFPQYLIENKGKLTFWITEKSVPLGYERIEEDIGFEAYYEVTPDGTLQISYMNVLDGLSYYHIVDQEYDQYEKEDYMQVDIRLKVINQYGDIVDKANLNTLKIEKVDSKNENTKLEGATFQITLTYPTSGKLRTIETTNIDGIASIENLYFPEGTSTIEIVEKNAPYGYILDSTPNLIKVTNTAGNITVEGASVDSNRIINVKLTNTHKQYAVPFNVVVKKRDGKTKELIDSTANFNINITKGGMTSTYNKNTTKGTTQITNLNGTGNIEISVQEKEAPYRYKLNDEIATAYITKQDMYSDIAVDTTKTQSSNVSISGNTVYFTVYDEQEEINIEPSLQIKKVSTKNTDLRLRNAKFSITMPNNEGTRNVTTGYSGYASLILKNGISGRYIIQETEAPTGYNLSKKVAIDVVFDENKNITSCELVKGLGEEYVDSIISNSHTAKTIYLNIGDTPIVTTQASTYTVKIDKVDKNNKQEKLDGAIFDISINQQNGLDYSLTKETMYERGINIYGLEGTGKIDVNLQEVTAPWGYVYDGTVRKLSFTRDEVTKALTLDVNSLINVNESDINVNNINHTITITIENTPKSYTPVIKEDGTEDPTPIPEGKIYNSITIENEYIRDHLVKIEGTTFRIYRLGSYVSQGTTNQRGLTTISLGNTEYYTVEDYLIKNYEMRASSYIKNQDVVLRITYGEDGTMRSAEIISGEQDSQGRIVAEIDKTVNYVGNHRIKVKIRCDKKAYTPVSGTTPEDPKVPTTPTGTIKPEEKPSPITPVSPSEQEPDFGITLEKVNIFNNRIKVKNARYAINILNEETNESETKIGTTDSAGKISLTGLLGFGNFKITVIEISSPEEYALDENKQVVRIHRDQESQMITMLDKDLSENASARIDNINKMVKITIQETPSTIGFAILKQDYEDELIGLKNSKFQITDNETNDTYELETLEEGMGYISLPIKENGLHTFTLREMQAPVGYNALTDTLTLKVNYLNGLITSAQIVGNDELAYVTTQNTEYIEANILNAKNTEHGTKYDIELIKADAYYSSITFENAKIKLDIDNEIGQSGISKTALTNIDGKINVNNIYGTGKVTIKITEIEPPAGRRFDTKGKQVILNIDEETGWIKLDKQTSNVDAFVDNDTKKITIRIRNYPDGTFVIGANKVDEVDNDLILYGAKYQIQMEGSSTVHTLVQYSNGLITAQDILMPSPVSVGTYTYTITEIEAPFGYKLNTVPTVLKVQVSKVDGINKITNAYIESGNGTVEVYGDEYVHLKLTDTPNEIEDPEGNNTYKITINKVDSMDKTYVIPNTLIGVQVQAESGENYYKEIKTDKNGQINLNDIKGTGRITVKIEEIKAAPNYLLGNNVTIVTFTRDPETKQITINEETHNVVVTEEGNVNITIENTLDLEKAVVITVNKVWQDTEEQKVHRPESIKIQIKRGDQVVQEKEILNTEEVAIFTNLPKYDEHGNVIVYTISEAEVNTGDLKYYVPSYDEETNTITNTYILNASIRKVIKDTSVGLGGATIVLIDEQGNETEGVTNEEGYVIFENLEKGKTYTYKEVKAPTGYVLNENIYTLTVNENGTINYGENGGIIENEKITANAEITKYEKGTETPVEGAIIGLFDKDGNALIAPNGEQIKARTDSTGKIRIINLGIGTYCYKEIEAPTGYVLNDEMYTITVNEEGEVIHGENGGIIYNEKVKTDVTITKYIKGTNTGLAGAKIGIYDENGNPLTDKEGQAIKLTTGENGQVTFEGLEVGTYGYKEEEAPIGYELNTNVYTFTINADGTVTYGESKGIIYNEKIKVNVEITKYIKGTEEPLEGAKIGLYDNNGNPITNSEGNPIIKTTGENGKIEFTNLEAGTYKYKEIEAPIGYELNEKMYTFRIGEDGTITHGTNGGVIYNEAQKHSASIVKYIKGTKTPVPGAVIGLFDEEGEAIVGTNGQAIELTTGENGQVTFTNLEAGTYYYKEIEAPNGYELNEEMYTFTVNKDGTISHGENGGIIYNETIKTNVEITKRIEGSQTPLEGAEITLYDADRKQIVTKTTEENGKVIFENLEEGTYYYKETKAPNGYVLNEEMYTFTVNNDGTITYGENGGIIYNDIIRVNVTIKKYEKGTGVPLAGAVIGLFDKEGNALIGQDGEQIKATTGTNGEIRILNLREGTYIYKEIEAPEGYILNNTMYTFVVEKDGSIIHGDNKGIIYNKKKPLEPVDPDDPNKPPVDPDDPNKPPVDPDDPNKPPVDPDDPNKPPVDPDDPNKPPVDPDDPNKPPVDPDDPNKPPVDPDDPNKPPVDPDGPNKPPVDSDKPTNPDKPNEPTSPNVPVNPVKPDRPNDYIGNLPKTGETIVVLMMAVVALSGSGIILTYNYIKIKKVNK